MKIFQKSRKQIALFFLITLSTEFVMPVISQALSSGPTQPEVQSFEPVGTSDMVDLFTGDFVYNIPLLDVDGYPVNISYHGGVTMDQEASWVGLGWNINPGAINRAIRGLPDDFNGDTIQKDLHIKDEITKKIGLGGDLELLGVGQPYVDLSMSLGGVVNMSNYRGVSVDLISNLTAQVNVGVSVGFNLGASVGSQSGASINYGTSIGIGASQSITKGNSISGSFNLNGGGTYSPRTGLKRDIGFNIGLAFTNAQSGRESFSTGTSIPIGLQNYTPAISYQSSLNSIGGRLKIGGEIFGGYPDLNVNGSVSTLHFLDSANIDGYGYFNYENATDFSLKDFSREKDGMFNTTMHFLPQSTMTYDVYSVSGQGTGGSFRPFRNDFGYVNDPFIKSPDSKTEFYELEGAIGDLFEFGGDASKTISKIQSGPWTDYQKKFVKDDTGSSFEKVYFKEAGELTYDNKSYMNQISNFNVINPNDVANLGLTKKNIGRVTRANLITVRTAKEASIQGIGCQDSIQSFTSSTGFTSYASNKIDSINKIPRYKISQKLARQPYHVSEITQLQKDGRKYVYGIPTINNIQKEATFSIDNSASNNQLVGFTKGTDDSKQNNKGLEQFYSSTITPTYSTSYLLTAVYSPDYLDITGNGPSDDDMGAFTKFNYSLKNEDYRWRAPINQDSASYNTGYYSDKRDDKASYTSGSREQWMLHSIETKNNIAEFYVSERLDAKGITDKIINEGFYNYNPYNNTLSKCGSSYKLDSIKLYTKQDRLLNGASAIPIKTVIFTYDYSLCKKLPNSDSSASSVNSGKLTLRKISFRYGNSNRSMINPYLFDYSTVNPDYMSMSKDRWGYYKPNSSSFNNHEFPYTQQNSNTDVWASAWSLTQITLPSGGIIQVNYEADDYGYVQNKEAMEMFKVVGFGRSQNLSLDDELYLNKENPNDYLYFQRDTNRELYGRSIKDQYLKGTNVIAYNIPVNLADDIYEPIKGYAEVLSIGICPNDTNYCYIQIKKRDITGGGANVNPITETALNVGRYNLPHVFFPGSNPESSDIDNVVAGLKNSIEELFKIGKNPIENYINENRGKDVDLNKSYIRLTSVGLKKKGGGQRVRSIYFYDNWNSMVANGAPNAYYGKEYNYTTNSDDNKAIISSGIASYEPMIGGDENPFRVPVGYTSQSGNDFPPNNPVDLYQEMPIGESFFPTPVVGYSKITVKSLHFESGRSSHYKDIYEFYTAKDYPVITKFSPIQTPTQKMSVGIQGINIEQAATQGFMVALNDMHGKPKSTTKIVVLPKGGEETVNYQQFFYKSKDGSLVNNIDVIKSATYNGLYHDSTCMVGVDADVTLDSRHREETSSNAMLNGNCNGFIAWIIPIVIPWAYGWSIDNSNKFSCAAVTKVVQQYGILDSIKNYSDGTITVAKNESYDPFTGAAVLSTVNNEYNDKEYTATYPAYWGYKGMGPAYQNINYIKKVKHMYPYVPASSISNDIKFGKNYGLILCDPGMYRLGDEVLLTFNNFVYHVGSSSSVTDTNQKYIVGRVVDYFGDVFRGAPSCGILIQPNHPKEVSYWNTFDSINNITLKIINSGFSNQLTEVGENLVTIDKSNFYPYYSKNQTNIISLNGKTFSRKILQLEDSVAMDDTSLNVYLNGKFSRVYKPQKSFVYNTNRIYTNTTSRNSGLFNVDSASAFFQMHGKPYREIGYCAQGSNFYFSALLQNDLTFDYDYFGGPLLWSYGNFYNFIPSKYLLLNEVTKYDIQGNELENLDALYSPSSVVYDKLNQSPIVVAQNAYYGSAFAENFEDLDLLVSKEYPTDKHFDYYYSPFQKLFNAEDAYGRYAKRKSTNSNLLVSNNQSHTGIKSLKITGDTYFETSLGINKYGDTSNTSYIYTPNVNYKKRKEFNLEENQTYIASVWIRKDTINSSSVVLGLGDTINNFWIQAGSNYISFIPKTNIIDGWQQYELKFSVPTILSGQSVLLRLPNQYYFDDLRLFPDKSNMKSFVYNFFNGRLMATLDENNYASFYEYDNEGHLIRTKKETDKGILTITESRQASPKTN